MKPFAIRAALSVLVVLTAQARVVLAQEPNNPFAAQGFQENRSYFSHLPFESIDTLSGNLHLRIVDLELPGEAGFNLRIERTYNSKDEFVRGWKVGLPGVPMSVQEWTGHTPLFFMADGSTQRTAFSTQFSPPAAMTRHFWRYDQSAHLLELPNGYVGEFGHAVTTSTPSITMRFLTTLSDPFLNVIRLEWEPGPGGGQRLKQITQELGDNNSRVVTFTYHATGGHILSMTFGDRVWRYEYTTGASGEPVEFVRPPAGAPWRYEYDPVSGDLKSITTPNGGRITYTYVMHEFAYLWVGPDTHVFSKAVKTRTTAGDRNIEPGTWTFTYDHERPSQTKVEGPCNIVMDTYNWLFVGDQEEYALETRAVFASLAQPPLERETLGYHVILIASAPSGSISAAVIKRREIVRATGVYTTTFDYSPTEFGDYGRPFRITEVGDGGATRETTIGYRHNFPRYLRGKVVSETVKVGTESFAKTFQHDSLNGFVTEQIAYGIPRTFEPDARGNVRAEIDAHGHRTEYFHEWGTVREIRTPKYTIVRDPNEDGTIASETRRGFTTGFQHDEVGRLKTRTPPVGNPTGITYDPAGATVVTGRGDSSTTTFLDGFGRARATKNSQLIETMLAFDACGRKTFESYPFKGSALGTAIHYDAIGRVTRRINPDLPDPSEVRYEYEPGNVTKITDEEGRVTRQTWRAFGDPSDARLVKVTDAHVKDTHYEYNTLGRLTKVIHPQGPPRQWVYNARNQLESEAHPESGTVTYEYDPAGNLTKRTDAHGLTQLQYDENERLVFVDKPGSSHDVTIGYDESDNRRVLANGFVTSTFDVDGANRLVKRKDVVNDYVFASRFEYDPNDNPAEITYPSGRRVTYDYDSENRIKWVKQDGQLVADLFKYHPSGALEEYVAANKIVHKVDFHDQRYWPERVTAPPLDLTYGYDLVGNVRTITDARVGFNQIFTYDNLDRLKIVEGFGENSFGYDDLGNRTGKASPAVGYQYDSARNRLITANGVEAATFHYDDNAGNITRITGSGAGTFAYTPDNMLEVATVGGQTTVYRYDGDNVRTIKFLGDSNDMRIYFLRAAGLQTLTEFSQIKVNNRLSRLRLERDYIYAGARLIAATTSTPAGAPPGLVP